MFVNFNFDNSMAPIICFLFQPLKLGKVLVIFAYPARFCSRLILDLFLNSFLSVILASKFIWGPQMHQVFCGARFYFSLKFLYMNEFKKRSIVDVLNP